LVHGDFKGAGKFLKRLDGRGGVSVFYPGGVTPEQSRLSFEAEPGTVKNILYNALHEQPVGYQKSLAHNLILL
jgi:hypothetical protein